MRTHTISFPEKIIPAYSYDIIIGRDLLPEAIERALKLRPGRKAAILTDKNVLEKGHLHKLDPMGRLPYFAIEPDCNGGVESRKNLENFGWVIDFLEARGIEKNDILACLGGGVVGDIGGLVAATYKRGGMLYVQVPTTTLSQADSCVGGKCAIDSNTSKNAIGGFYQPHLVVIDVNTLDTLDDRNFRSGIVESVKHGLILDDDYFGLLENRMSDILSRDKDLLEEIALRNVQLKGKVVEIDPEETNYRRALNFGHTKGHAIEIVSGYRIYHGEAVSFGIIAALHISRNIRGFPGEEFERARKLLIEKMGMPEKVPDYVDRKIVEQKLANDKKAVNGVPHFVTLDRIGKLHLTNASQYAEPIPKEALDRAMDYIFAR